MAASTFYTVTALYARYVRGHFIEASRDFWWMSPIAYTLFFLIAATPLLVVAVVSTRLVPLTLAVWSFAALAVFAALLPYTQISRAAAAILAAGVGVQAARTIAGNPERWFPQLRASALALALLFAGAGIFSRGLRAINEARGFASLAPTVGGAPNVLLIILDTVRADALGLYGSPRPTSPNIDAFASGGVVFNRAFSTSPWTLPSHASMFTGVYASQQSGDFLTPFDGQPRTLAEVLRERGYATVAFVANHHYASYESGLNEGFIAYNDFNVSLRQVLKSSSIGQTEMLFSLFDATAWSDVWRALRASNLYVNPKPESDPKRAPRVTDEFLAWQQADSQGSRSERPYFAFLNYFDAHKPHEPPEPWATKFVKVTPRELGRYEGEVALIDHEVGRLLDSLKGRGVLERTIVVITSDHGEHFGEHGLNGHGNSLYLPVLHAPLIIRYPRTVPAGVRVTESVSLRDLAATILDLSGAGTPHAFPGASLAGTWRQGDAKARSEIVAELSKGIRTAPNLPVSRGSMRTLIDSSWHYIRNGDGREELYDLRTDLAEQVNLADSTRARGVLSVYRTRVQRALEKQ